MSKIQDEIELLSKPGDTILETIEFLGDSIELQLDKLLKLDPEELKITKQNKYLKIT